MSDLCICRDIIFQEKKFTSVCMFMTSYSYHPIKQMISQWYREPFINDVGGHPFF